MNNRIDRMDPDLRRQLLRFHVLLIMALATGVLFLIASASTLSADTIFLMNGRSFNGKVTEHSETAETNGDEGLYRVFFGSTDRNSEEYRGYIDVRKKDVKDVEVNDLDAFSIEDK